jgi:hypothetical protein
MRKFGEDGAAAYGARRATYQFIFRIHKVVRMPVRADKGIGFIRGGSKIVDIKGHDAVPIARETVCKM